MKEKPILFQGPMAKAIRDGAKTQTRRIVKINERGLLYDLSRAWIDSYENDSYLHVPFCTAIEGWQADPANDTLNRVYCPYGNVGDRLWVKETFQICALCGAAIYRADNSLECEVPCCQAMLGKWKPSIFMPRDVSRITLGITSVKVERLQDISHEDAKAEGVTEPARALGKWWGDMALTGGDYRGLYRLLWESINGKGSWARNPWVWKISFTPFTP